MRTTATLALALTLCACPVRPKDDEGTDDGAAETTGEQGPVEPDPQTAKPGPAKGEAEKAK